VSRRSSPSTEDLDRAADALAAADRQLAEDTATAIREWVTTTGMDTSLSRLGAALGLAESIRSRLPRHAEIEPIASRKADPEESA
jgi:hypothetical protein